MKPLAGIRVLDLSRVLAGPFCTMNLGDMGAEVIKIEEPGAGDDTRAFAPPLVNGVSTYYLSINRNKKSVAINLKQPAGLALVKRLAAGSDVLVENFRPGVAQRLGLGPQDLRREHPRLIYCSISGFGHQGLPEYSRLPGYDAVVQGLSGLQHITGDPSGPPTRAGVPIADILSGMTAFQAITLALFVRERTGEGQVLDVAMLDSTIQVLTFQASAHLNAGKNPIRMGNRHPSIAPYETFKAEDGYVNLAVGNDVLFKKLCELIGRPELAGDPRFSQNRLRVENRPALLEVLDEVFARRKVVEWLRELEAAGIPCGEIADLPRALSHPQLEARGMIARMQHPVAGPLRLVGSPLPLAGVGRGQDTAPPLLGEHTREVLSSTLGLSQDEIRRLAADGAIAGPDLGT